MGLAAAVSFAAVWAWVALMPLAFLDPEYPAWRAKEIMLRRCDLGDVLVLGDSRAAAGVIPALLPVKTSNFAIGGGEPIEAYAALTRALACPRPPKLVILSLDPGHFTQPDLFWERTVHFGFLNAAEIAALRAISRKLHDYSVYEVRHTDGTPSWLRDWLYSVHFPTYYFADLVKSGAILRWPRNNILLADALAARGHYYFGTANGSAVVAAEGRMTAFRPLPVLAYYFDRIVGALARRSIPAVFVAMPVNATTARAMQPALRDGFAAWLAGYQARYPDFHVVGPALRPWPDRWFGDGFSHLNPAGAERFSALLSSCLIEPIMACDLRWRAPAETASATTGRPAENAE